MVFVSQISSIFANRILENYTFEINIYITNI